MKKLILSAVGLCLLAGTLITGSFVAGKAAANEMNQNSNEPAMMMNPRKITRKHRRHKRWHKRHHHKLHATH